MTADFGLLGSELGEAYPSPNLVASVKELLVVFWVSVAAKAAMEMIRGQEGDCGQW
jgi:hypothetical protein